MQTKEFRATFKAVKDDDGQPTGEVTAIVSAFGNVDLVGDVVQPTAFDGSIDEWKDSGDHIPMIWSHDWANPMSHIGAWDPSKAKATKEGLELSGRVFIGEGNPIADQAFKLMDTRLVREFSFAYDILDESPIKEGDLKGANSLNVLSLIEAGPTLKGANPATRLVEAKMQELAAAKAGRALSTKNESTLREAVAAMKTASTAIEQVLSAVEPDEEKAAPKAHCVDCDAELTEETTRKRTVSDDVVELICATCDEKVGESEDGKSFSLRMQALLS